MKLYNTLTKKVEVITPQNPPAVTIYTCGPTVYDYPHVGNWFTFIRYDLLVRTLKASGLQPKWVMNITDVGHLVSDADEGEDKLEKGAKREGKTAWDVARFYGDYFVESLKRLNVTTPDYLPKATDHIAEQIELVKKLEEKGYTYVIGDGVYYDTAKFPRYADFAQLDLDEQQAGARVERNPEKRNPTDFALWKFSPKDHQRDMEWWAPWRRSGENSEEKHPIGARAMRSDEAQDGGEQRTEPYKRYGEGAAEATTQRFAEKIGSTSSSAGRNDDLAHGSWGFPGWHLECSAMAMKYLGETIDIHAGGIDHVPVHHTNEIAQSEAVTGKPFARTWMHTNHITVEGEKISKSLGNGITLEDIEKKGYSLEAFRLHVLESHYHSQSKFSWESLEAAQNRLNDIQAWADLRYQPSTDTMPDELDQLFKTTREEMLHALQDDLNTPAALTSLSKLISFMSNIPIPGVEGKYTDGTLALVESLTGLKIADRPDITDEQKTILQTREKARIDKDWAKSDQLRDQLREQGIGLRDTPHGAIWYRI